MEIDSKADVMARLESIRSQGAVLMGLAHLPQLEMLTELTPGATAEILENIEPEFLVILTF